MAGGAPSAPPAIVFVFMFCDNRCKLLMSLYGRIREDIGSVLERDPAARSRLEVFLCYPGLWAVWIHRISHGLWRARLRLPARLLSQVGRFFTGVDIHPGALLGRRLFIDHATGW